MVRWATGAVCGLLVAALVPPAGATVRARGSRATAPPWALCHVTLDGVAVKVRSTERTRTIVDGATRRRAQLSFWIRDDSPCGFVRVFTTRAWVGQNGVSDGRTRRQGSLTTPTGTYTMTEAFGILPNPGTALPYHQVVPGDWWVQDNTSPYYNTLRNEQDGGFHPKTHGVNGSERLMDHGVQYTYAVVVNFNRPPDRQVPKRGSGIFLHVNSGKGATAGCVSIGRPKLRLLISLLYAGDRVSIVR